MIFVRILEIEYFVIFIVYYICFDRVSFIIFLDDWMDFYDVICFS